MDSLHIGKLNPHMVLEVILSYVNVGVCCLDDHQRIIYANSALCQILGCSLEEIQGVAFPRLFAMYEAKGEELHHGYFWRKDGTTVSVQYKRKSVVENGQVTGAIVILQQATDGSAQAEYQSVHQEPQIVQYIQMLSNALERIHSSLDHHERLQRIASAAIPYLGNRVSVDLWDPSAQTLTRSAIVTAESLRTGAPAGGECVFAYDEIEGAPLGKVIQERQPMVINGITFEAIDRHTPGENLRKHTRELNPTAMMIVPIEYEDQVLGVVTFSFSDREGFFSPLDLLFAQVLARHAGLAIYNNRLYLEAQQYMRVIEESTDVIWLLDRHGRVMFFNDRARQSFGWTHETIGHSMLDLAVPKHYEGLVTNLRQLMSGQAIEDVEGRFVVEGRELVFSFSGIPIILNDSVTGACVFGRDITDLVRTQDRLQGSLERLERLQELNKQLLECDTRRELTAVTVKHLKALQQFEAAYCFHCSPSSKRLELWAHAGSPTLDTLSLAIPTWWNQPNWANLRQQGGTVQETVILRHIPGTLMQELAVPVWHESRMVALLVVLNTDSDGFQAEHGVVLNAIADALSRYWERSYLNEQLRETTEEMEAFLFATSHDLRSPLVNTAGFTKELEYAIHQVRQVLAAPQVPGHVQEQINAIWDEDIEPSTRFIHASVRKIEGLVEGILQLSRVGRMPLNLALIKEPENLVHGLVNAMQLEIDQTGAVIEIGRMPPVYADPTRLEQIFYNLIGNAVKYLDPNRPGIIRIWGEQTDGTVRFCVADNGIGIHPAHIGQVFRPFHRLDTTNRVQGHGLGLSIVERAVRRHHGKLWVESVPGEGSRFWFELPRGD